MSCIVISSKETDYAAFVTETLNLFEDYKIKGLAIVALTEDENLTAYWNMSLRDKATAETEIRYDTIDSLIMANRDRYGIDGGDE